MGKAATEADAQQLIIGNEGAEPVGTSDAGAAGPRACRRAAHSAHYVQVADTLLVAMGYAVDASPPW